FHFCIRLVIAFWFEDWVPAKLCRSSWLHNPATASTIEDVNCAAFFSRAVPKYTLSIGAFVFKAMQHLQFQSQHTSRSNAFQEPFDVGSRHPSQGIEAQTDIFNHN
ncbi:hypothetical protein EGW08_003733, partial [Elysia chlorotica]